MSPFSVGSGPVTSRLANKSPVWLQLPVSSTWLSYTVQPLLISRVSLFWPCKEGLLKRGTNEKGQEKKKKSVNSFAPSQPVSLLLNLEEAALLCCTKSDPGRTSVASVWIPGLKCGYQSQAGSEEAINTDLFIPKGTAERFLGQELLYKEVFSLSTTPVYFKLGWNSHYLALWRWDPVLGCLLNCLFTALTKPFNLSQI